MHTVEGNKRLMWARSNSKSHLNSPSSPQNLDIAAASWRMESIVRDSDSGSEEDDEDEFFDCQGKARLFCYTKIYCIKCILFWLHVIHYYQNVDIHNKLFYTW